MLGLIGWFWQADCVEIKEHALCGRVFSVIIPERGFNGQSRVYKFLLEVLSTFRK